MKNVRINVTKKDIKNGTRSDSDECPIARACRRAGLKNVSVGGRTVTCDGARPRGGTTSRRQFKVPQKATNFISAFDGGRDVAAFAFTLTT